MKLQNLIILADMYGCPNRCKHCWIGHMPNKKMSDNSDEIIVNYFKPHFDSITFYSWLREPDFCNDYKQRWIKDNQISVNAKPQRFELGSFWRLVRDKNYVHFLKNVGVKKVQLTFFGMEEMTDWYIGRKGAFNELLQATEILLNNKIAPRWQVFINANNSTDIIKLLAKSKELKLSERCKTFGEKFDFFIHSGSCDGENRKLYSIRINKEDVPSELIPYYNNFSETKTESQLYELLKNDESNFSYNIENEITLNVSNNFDVYFNFTHIHPKWKIGNILTDDSKTLVQKIVDEDIPALNLAKKISVKDLTIQFGNPHSHKIFDCIDDYKSYLLNEMIERKKNEHKNIMR